METFAMSSKKEAHTVVSETKADADILKRVHRNGRVSYKARYRDPHGARRSKTFARLADARAWQREMKAQVTRAEWTNPDLGRNTFSEAVDLWRSNWVNLKPTTKERYESILRIHVLPAFGKKPVGSITKPMVQAFVSKLVASPNVSEASVWRIVDVIRGPLKAAYEAEWIRKNPASRLNLPKIPEEEMLFLAEGQVRDLAEAITSHYRTVIYFTAYVGFRAGEVWGLQVRDLDLLRGRATVRRTLIEIRNKPTFGTPKNNRSRTVFVPPFLREMLAADLERRFGGSAPPASAQVFVTQRGLPVRHSNFMRRHFYPAVRGREVSLKRRGTAGRPAIPSPLPEDLRGLRFHDLRHTAASIAAASGAQPKEVQGMLGHKSIAITMDRYTHLFPDRQEDLARRMDAAYRAAEEEAGAKVIPLRPTADQ